MDLAGNVLFTSHSSLLKVDRSGTLSVIAGTGSAGFSGDGGPAISAGLAISSSVDDETGNILTTSTREPQGLVMAPDGSIYFSDSGNYRVRKISPSGIITTIAGNGVPGFAGDGRPAISARLEALRSLALDSNGNLFIASGSRVRKLSRDGLISTVAGGTRENTYSGEGIPATQATFSQILGLAVDRSGNLFITNQGTPRILIVSGSTGIISTFAGTGVSGYSGDGDSALKSQLVDPGSLAIGSSGTLWLADGGHVRKISPNGVINTIAGSTTFGLGARGEPIILQSEDGDLAGKAQLSRLSAIAVDPTENLYIAGPFLYRVQIVRSSDNTISTLAGNGLPAGYYSGDGGPALNAHINNSGQIATDVIGNLYIADRGNHRIRKVLPNGLITTLAGTGTAGFSGDGGAAAQCQLSAPSGVIIDGDGNIFISDTGNHRIRKVSPTGIITTIAGNGSVGFSGDGGPAFNAAFSSPVGLGLDAFGAVYVIDRGNSRIRKIAKDGLIVTIAGNGMLPLSSDYSSSSRTAKNVGLAQAVTHLFVSPDGTFYFSESGGSADGLIDAVRKVSSDGQIFTIAGGAGRTGFSGDGNAAAEAHLQLPQGVVADNAGNLYIADGGNRRIRRIDDKGIISTIAGTGKIGNEGFGGPADQAQLYGPMSLSLDSKGNLYFLDSVGGQSSVRYVGLLQRSTPITLTGIRNAASYEGTAISPGEIVTVYGVGMGPARLAQSTVSFLGLIPTELAGTQVLFDGVAAPLLYTSSNQIAAVVPYSVNAPSVSIIAKFGELKSAAMTVPITSTVPGLFTLDVSGIGQAAAINQDGSINTATTPAAIGSIILLFATGEGQTTPVGVDGKTASTPLPQPIETVTVLIDGIPAAVRYAGGAPGLIAGLMQVNVEIPPTVRLGARVPIILRVGAKSSQLGTSIAVKAN